MLLRERISITNITIFCDLLILQNTVRILTGPESILNEAEAPEIKAQVSALLLNHHCDRGLVQLASSQLEAHPRVS